MEHANRPSMVCNGLFGGIDIGPAGLLVFYRL